MTSSRIETALLLFHLSTSMVTKIETYICGYIKLNGRRCDRKSVGKGKGKGIVEKKVVNLLKV